MATYIPWLLLACGILGVVLGVDRTLKRREKESRLLQVIAFLAGTVLLAAPVAMVLRGENAPMVSELSILLMMVLGICLVGRALKSLPIAFIIVTLMGTGLFWLFSYVRQFSFAGDIPLQAIVFMMVALLLVVFGISFFIEKTIDLFLGLLSLGPVVFIVAAAAFLQGLLIVLHFTDQHGLMTLLGS